MEYENEREGLGREVGGEGDKEIGREGWAKCRAREVGGDSGRGGGGKRDSEKIPMFSTHSCVAKSSA